ncbi:uncharacterized protein EV420DRAFT_1480315 [Desarmillaria tabescens]|uniref:F-box domain-containing protein n=1 Tax=Armillaria tabescens TaxID=1929756 RepID=A0AA39KD55_ARMTA|nr:uncharacterized protein EV420DRAFT_1480315 [Desarmillaria tabescens]KAK0457676.1 hypothetical protein EV420DRAFT_1480315 [Desarmillaria tabescens]
MSASFLPQEILGIIVDHLHDDLSSCIALSQTHRTLKDAAYTHIFKNITIDRPHNGIERCSSTAVARKFRRFAAISSGIAKYVGEIVLRSGPAFNRTTERGYGWMYDEPQLPQILLSLTNLRSILIESHDLYEDDLLKWDRMSAELKCAFTHVIELPRLHTITFIGFEGYPISLFSATPSLKSLNVYHSRPKFDQTCVSTVRASVNELSLRMFLPYLQDHLRWITSPRSPINTSRLTQLSLAPFLPVPEQTFPNPSFHREVDELLRTSPNLEQLSFTPLDQDPHIIHLTHNARLCSVEFSMNTGFIGRESPRLDFIHWVAMVLETIPSSAPLENILLFGESEEGCVSDATKSFGCAWDKFDEAATRESWHGTLKRVSVSFEGVWSTTLEKGLDIPKLRDSGVLEIELN